MPDFIDDFIVDWNSRFPCDYWWRKKYNIPFNSPQHQEMCQSDILFEYREEMMRLEYEQKIQEREEKQKEYSKGIWLRNPVDNQTQDENIELFDNIDVSLFNQPQTDSPTQDNG